MAHYIDADCLRAEIEKTYKLEIAPWLSGVSPKSVIYEYVLPLIDSLQQEQPEVDLEKELDQWRHEHFAGERDGHYSGEYLERSSQLDLARHFFNLGLNARKEENK